MVRMKKVSGSAGKEIITKERALKSFRKISNMTTVLTMRYDRQRIVSKAREEGNGDLANWYLGR